MSPRQPFKRRCGLPLVLLVCALLATVPAAAQSVWEMTPYRTQLLVAFTPAPELTPRLRTDLVEGLVDRIDAIVGAPLDVTIQPADAALGRVMASAMDDVTVESLPQQQADLDKIMLLAVVADVDGCRVVARDFDIRTQIFGASVSRPVRQLGKLRDVALGAVFAAFAPLARIERVEVRSARKTWVTLRLKAGALPPRDGELTLVEHGDPFRPVIRYNDRDGNLRKDDDGNVIRPRPVPWTYCTVQESRISQLICRLHTGLRSPLSGRRRGRVEQFALAVVLPEKPSVLTLVQAKSDPPRPLAGYGVYAHPPDSNQGVLLGRTDRRGRLTIRPDASGHAIRMLLVRNGSELLAHLPVVPGVEPELLGELPNDDQRLKAEGFITGLQEQMVDVTTRREVLFARARLRIESGKFDEAQQFLEEVRQLPTAHDLSLKLDAPRNRVRTGDSRMQAKINALFSDTAALIQQQLDPRALEALRRQLREARQAAGS